MLLVGNKHNQSIITKTTLLSKLFTSKNLLQFKLHYSSHSTKTISPNKDHEAQFLLNIIFLPTMQLSEPKTSISDAFSELKWKRKNKQTNKGVCGAALFHGSASTIDRFNIRSYGTPTIPFIVLPLLINLPRD